MELDIYPSQLRGSITPPPSKSQSHRLIIAAALADGRSEIRGAARSRDIDATLSCMEALGAKYAWSDGKLIIDGNGGKKRAGELPILDCCESGSTLRFLIPIALVTAGGGEFRGRGRLMERPQEPYFEIFQKMGIEYERRRDALSVSGKLIPGEYALRGDVSSQFVTGLLYALSLTDGESRIRLTTPLESKSYVDMTLDAMRLFGANARELSDGYEVSHSHYLPHEALAEADWSQAGFFFAANALGGKMEINGLNENSSQGDRIIRGYCERLAGSGEVRIDVSDCPDLVPALALIGACRGGRRTRIDNAARLRMKESDRLASVTEVLTALGAKISEMPDALIIDGTGELSGGAEVSAHNDHRIAMMAAVAAARCKARVTLVGAESVEKSYPEFWNDMEKLGLKFVARKDESI